MTEACETPLVDLLRRIPLDAVLSWREKDGLQAYCSAPVGLYAHEAADRLDRDTLRSPLIVKDD